MRDTSGRRRVGLKNPTVVLEHHYWPARKLRVFRQASTVFDTASPPKGPQLHQSRSPQLGQSIVSSQFHAMTPGLQDNGRLTWTQTASFIAGADPSNIRCWFACNPSGCLTGCRRGGFTPNASALRSKSS